MRNTEMQRIEERQEAILAEMGRIRTMRRGTISAQEYGGRRSRKGGKGATGPYFLWQGYVGGRRFGRRVGAEEAARMRDEIEQRCRFEALCAEYVALGETLAERRNNPSETDRQKKTPKSRSRRARK